MGNVLAKDNAAGLHALSKVSDTDTGLAQFTSIGKNPTDGFIDANAGGLHWTAATSFGPFGRPVTVRLYIKVTNNVSITVQSQPDHIATPNNLNAPHVFHDVSQDISAFGPGAKIVDVKGADVIILTPSADAGASTVIAVPLYY